ncbi:MAG: hypothetical protein EAY79_11950, partial [Runella slithyformis]
YKFKTHFYHKLTFTQNKKIMKKLVLKSIVALSLAILSLSAQAQLNKGDKQLNVGAGLFGLGFNATAQYGIIDDLGVGLYVGYERNTFGLGLIGFNYSTNSIMAGPVGTYHFNRILNMKSDKFDLYASAGFLIRRVSFSNEWTNFYNVTGRENKFDFLGRVGAKYNFSEKMSLFGDIGAGGSWIQGGVSFKF